MTNPILKSRQLKNGGLLVPLTQTAQKEINHSENYLAQAIHLERGSILMFSSKLPKRTTITGNSVVRLDKDSMIDDSIINNSKIYLHNNIIKQSKIDHSQIDAAGKENADIYESSIVKYDIKDSNLTGKLHLSSESRHSCAYVAGHDLIALDSALLGGTYENSTVTNSIIEQPATSLIRDSSLAYAVFLNHEQVSPYTKTQDINHVIEGSTITKSTIINDSHHGFYLTNSKMNHCLSINGLIAEHSNIQGPHKPNHLLLNNLMFDNDNLDFRDAEKSIKVAGLPGYHKNTHTDNVYYTNLRNDHTFNLKNIKSSHNVTQFESSLSLTKNIEQMHKQTSNYHMSVDTYQDKIMQASKKLDQHINQAIDPKAISISNIDLL